VKPTTVTAWEKGRNTPEASTVGALSMALSVPLAFFAGGEEFQPVDDSCCHYRRRRRCPAKVRHHLQTLAGLVNETRGLLQEYVRLPEPQIPSVPLAGTGGSDGEIMELSPSQVAGTVRRELGLGLGPIPNVVDLLELRGIWVSQLSGEFAEAVDAFSYWHNGYPYVVLNPAKKDAYRSRFDAAHELGHLVMHAEATEQNEKVRESEANDFGAAFLIPEQSWLQCAPRRQPTNPWRYLELKERWGVSVAAMLYRSRQLGLLNERQFKSAMVRYSSLGWRKGEPTAGPPRPHEAPRLPFLCRKALHEAGADEDWLCRQLGYPTDFVREVLPLPPPASNVIPLRRPR